MRWFTRNNTQVYQVILLFLLVFLSLSSIANSFPRDDDNGIWSLNCRRCKVYVRVGVSGAPVAPPDTSSSGKKPNVGAVVGFTFLLVFILVGAFVCIYWKRRSSSRGSARQSQVLVQPGVVREQVLTEQRVVRPGVHRDEKQGDDDKQRGKNEGRVPQRNGGVQPKRGVEGNQAQHQQEGPRDVGVSELKKRGGQGKPPPPRDVVVTEENKRLNVGKQKQQQRPQDIGANEQMKGKQPPTPPPLPPRDVGVREQKRKGMEEKQQPPPPARDVGVAEQKKKGMEVKEQQPPPLVPPRDVGVAKRKRRDGKGKGKEQQQPPLQDVGDDKRKKRGREGKQQPLLDEDVGRPHKREREEKQQYFKDNVGEEREKGGVMGKGQPRKDDVGEEKAKGRAGKQAYENSSGLPSKYDYSFLKTITNNFDKSNRIGRGGYGNVYRGRLSNGTMVAVKCLRYGGMIDDFKNEVEALARADHGNLVKLIGYCDDGIIRILVYEYMRRGSLDKWIFHTHPKRSLSWPAMKNVIQGIAQGLEYLHEKCEKKILHRDLKPPNVILDDDMNAKLCDFGLAKLINKDQSSASADWVGLGTEGYMAPEALQAMRISDKVDVYSFGVVVLEVVFGKHYQQIVRLGLYKKDFKLSDLIKEEMQRNVEEIELFVKLAVSCLRENPRDRPIMSAILAEIQDINEKTR